jgi:hypothetical protein
MKDEHSVLFRIAFALALAGALFAYAYFLYPSLRTQFANNCRARAAIEKEKEAVAEIMIDPGLISERITDMQGKLTETRPIKGLTPAGVADDITKNTDKLGIGLQSIVLGVPEAPGGEMADGLQLLLMPVTVRMTATYDEGARFVDALEKSETGTYKIGSFSFEPARTESDGADTDADTDDAKKPGDEDAAEAQPTLEWIITVYLLYYG